MKNKREERKRIIYALMQDKTYVPMKIKELAIILQVSKEERAQIEAFCAERIAVIDEYKVLMEQAVSEYFEKKLEPIFDALDSMDKAITDNDIDSYILGNYVIQERLTGKAIFKTREEFDSMMESDDPIKF